MYISEIDNILDETLDKFMYTWILESKIKDLLNFNTLIKEPNYVKYQKEINLILDYGILLISQKDLNKLVTKNSNIILINSLISKYLGYYLFLLIGINYKNKIELFNNNLIEFSRNQVNYSIKIDNFFNSESNSNIIKTINLANEFIDYINKLSSNKKFDKNNNLLNNYSDELKEFLINYGEENISKFIILINNKEITNKKIIIDHNIIKIMIYINLYKSTEKKELFNQIESGETSNGEFIFIDVVVPRSLFIDYNTIESILSSQEIRTNLPDTIYNLVNEDYSNILTDNKKYYTDFDLKIQKLFDTHIIIPIVDDFILYHKDNEKYEKQGDKLETPKKKEETKIKYIINKINTASEFYKNPEEIKKNFYTPLQNRNAVLINTYEDIKIISKMKNIIKMNNENNDLFIDLISYRMYPYIAFKEFQKNGFIFSSNHTYDGIRKISFDSANKKRNNLLQTRIISSNMLVNIVGFAIINKENELDCLDLNSFIDISKENSDVLTSVKVLLEKKIKDKFMKKNKLENKSDQLLKNYYWLFDLEKENYSIPYYDISSKMPKNDIIKIIIAYLYDYVIETIINLLKSDIKSNHPKYIIEYSNTIDKYKRLFPDIYNIQHQNDINELEYLIYYIKSIQIDDTYDYNEDEFPGLYGKIHMLPYAPPPKKIPIPVIKFTSDFKIIEKKEKKNIILNRDFEIVQSDYESNEHITAVCQHIISWENISEYKKLNSSIFSNLIYEFIQQYVEISHSLDFICKSCKSSINIKKYILDGVFDDSTQSFITFSTFMDVNIEDLPEYEKFKTSIRNIDKIIERMSSIFNIQGLNGTTQNVRSRRRAIVKDTLDLIIHHNIYLKKHYLNQRDILIDKFGINKKLSNLFIFELDNSIFIYSSKDKDFYKIIKYNNVISYILLLLILELNDTQILNLHNDKICSYYIFKKIGFSLFEGIQIIINKSYDMQLINKLPILCYIIYLTSCFITKYNLWADTLSVSNNTDNNTGNNTDNNKQSNNKKKFNPLIQKSIINTIVELLNTILRANIEDAKKSKVYLYEIIITKFYLKLELYKDLKLIEKLDKQFEQDTTRQIDKKILLDIDKFDQKPSKEIYNNFDLDNLYELVSKKYACQRIIPKVVDLKLINISKISNLTNCIDGGFHNFKTKGQNMTCSICLVELGLDLFIKDSEKFIEERVIINYIKKLARKYCIDGKIHQFDYNINKNNNICKKCNYYEGNSISYTDNELYKMYTIIQTNIIKHNLFIQEIINKNKTKNQNEIKIIKKSLDKIMYKFQKYDNNLNNSLDVLLDNMQKLLGTDILIDNKLHNLHNNIYIIDHDYNGTKLSNQIQINEQDKKFRFIDKHVFFKRDVLVYTIQKNTKYEVFYDQYDKYLLGYKEVNKEYVIIDKTYCKIQTNYSIKNMFKLLGFTRQFVNIKDFYPEIYGYTYDKILELSKLNNFSMNLFINKIAHKRFNIVKKLGYELNRYINRIKYNYQVKIFENTNPYETNTDPALDPINNPFDIIYNKFYKKFDTNIITIHNENKKEHIFLKYINTIQSFMPFIKISNTVEFSNYIDYNVIIKDDFSSNLVLNYIIDEINRLIQYNTNKVSKTNIILFIIELIWKLFSLYNYDIAQYDKDVNYFNQILYTSDFYLETQNNELMIDAIDYYGNLHNLEEMNEDDREKLLNEKDDNDEENIALDVDIELDYEGSYNLYTNYDYEDNLTNQTDRNLQM